MDLFMKMFMIFAVLFIVGQVLMYKYRKDIKDKCGKSSTLFYVQLEAINLILSALVAVLTVVLGEFVLYITLAIVITEIVFWSYVKVSRKYALIDTNVKAHKILAIVSGFTLSGIILKTMKALFNNYEKIKQALVTIFVAIWNGIVWLASQKLFLKIVGIIALVVILYNVNLKIYNKGKGDL